MSNKVYVILEDMGEWSDHTTTVVCVCSSEQLAQGRVLDLTQAAKVDAMLRRDLEEYEETFADSNPMKDVDYPDVNWARAERDPSYKAEKEIEREQWDAIYIKWHDSVQEKVKIKKDELAKTLDLSQFDETKDRYYDYPYYSYREVEFYEQ